MRTRRGVIALAVFLASGCHAGFRSTAGKATAPHTTGAGMTRSVSFGDEGGLMTMATVKLGLLGLGVVGGFGAVERGETKVSENIVYNPDGSKTLVREETTDVTVDTDAAQRSADLMNADVSKMPLRAGFRQNSYGSLATNLEIASQSLGGDTSGWMYELGWAHRISFRRDNLYLRARGFVGIGFGHFDYHGRMLERLDRGPPMFGDSRYSYLGFPLRLGVLVGKPRPSIQGLFPELGLEPFAKADLNLKDGPSPVHLGARFNWKYFYIESEWAVSGEGTSLGLEVGGGF